MLPTRREPRPCETGAKSKCGATRRHRQFPVAKQQPLDRSPWRCCPPLIMRTVPSMTDRGWRQTDEASRSQVGERCAGSSPACCFASSRLWHSGASLRASRRRGQASRVDSCIKPSRSRPIFQAIFCGPELWKTHGNALATSARAMPERSFRIVTIASPAAVNIVETARDWPEPSSTTSTAPGANSRRAPAAMAR